MKNPANATVITNLSNNQKFFKTFIAKNMSRTYKTMWHNDTNPENPVNLNSSAMSSYCNKYTSKNLV